MKTLGRRDSASLWHSWAITDMKNPDFQKLVLLNSTKREIIYGATFFFILNKKDASQETIVF